MILITQPKIRILTATSAQRKRNCYILGVLGESQTSYFSPRNSFSDFVKEQRLEKNCHFISTLQHKVHGGLGVRRGT